MDRVWAPCPSGLPVSTQGHSKREQEGITDWLLSNPGKDYLSSGHHKQNLLYKMTMRRTTHAHWMKPEDQFPSNLRLAHTAGHFHVLTRQLQLDMSQVLGKT